VRCYGFGDSGTVNDALDDMPDGLNRRIRAIVYGKGSFASKGFPFMRPNQSHEDTRSQAK